MGIREYLLAGALGIGALTGCSNQPSQTTSETPARKIDRTSDWYDKHFPEPRNIESLEAELTKNPDADGFVHLSGLFYDVNNLESFRRHSEKALQLDSMNASALNNIGLYHRKKGDNGKAEHFYEKALSVNPNLDHALNNVARIYHDKGQLKKSLEIFLKLKDVNPTYPDADKWIVYLRKKTK